MNKFLFTPKLNYFDVIAYIIMGFIIESGYFLWPILIPYIMLISVISMYYQDE
jgi:hypothetical protein